MRTVSIRQADMRNATIPIGCEGENEYTQVRIDCKITLSQHPDAEVSLAVSDPTGRGYTVIPSVDGTIVVWNVTDSDLSAHGYGEVQVVFTIEGTIIGKSDTARTVIRHAVDPHGGGGGGTGDYNDLENKPQLAGVTLVGNKSLHEFGIAAESDIPEVSDKADKVSGATSGNFAALDENGNLTDSGKKPSDFADKADTVLTSTLSRGRHPQQSVGEGSIAFGESVVASGNDSQAFGYRSSAQAPYSSAFGDQTTANHRSQHVFGEYNVPDPSNEATNQRGTYVEIVGNGHQGNSVFNSNARTLDWDGNERLQGDLYVNCLPNSSGGSKVAKVTDIVPETKPLIRDSISEIADVNLYNYAGIKNKYEITQSGSESANNSYCCTDVIPVTQGEYTFLATNSASWVLRVHAYSNGVWQREIFHQNISSSSSTIQKSFTVGQGEDGIRVSLSNTATNVSVAKSTGVSAIDNVARYAANAKYTKPSGGIPGTDLADSYIEEPSSEGTSGQVLTTDGNGGRSWTTVSGGGASIDDTAGEGDTDVVWSANKTWTKTEELKEAIAYKTPEMFGAVGDGETDDSEAVQDAVDSGYAVYFASNKTYYLASTVTIDHDCHLFGGENTVIKTATPDGGDAYDGIVISGTLKKTTTLTTNYTSNGDTDNCNNKFTHIKTILSH